MRASSWNICAPVRCPEQGFSAPYLEAHSLEGAG
jgi:hypothetical protein